MVSLPPPPPPPPPPHPWLVHPTSYSPMHLARGSKSLPTTVKEMLPIVLSATVWGLQWLAATHITCHCDKTAVVAWSSKVDHLIHLMGCIFYSEAYHGFTVHCTHLPGVQNTAADALTRNVLPLFHLQVQGADPSSRPGCWTPSALLRKDLDWPSPNWTAPLQFYYA